MSVGYDKQQLNHQLLLGMTFEEMIGGVGVLAVNGDFIYDRAKPHHRMTLIDGGTGTLTWRAAASGFPYLDFVPTWAGPIADWVWIEALAADTGDLNFTTEAFTLLAWVRLTNLARVHTVICRGAQAVANGGGYQLVIGATTPARLTFATCQGAAVQSSFSEALIPATTWCLVGATRNGAVGRTYINGQDRTDGPEDHVNPAAQNEPFHIGVRQIQTTGVGINYDTPFEGYIAYLRVWGGRALSRDGMLAIFNYERHWLGV